jgi:hypothetical protein
MSTRTSLFGLVTLLGGLLAACSGGTTPSTQSCSTASDCPSGQICPAGVCLLPDGGIPPNGGGDGGTNGQGDGGTNGQGDGGTNGQGDGGADAGCVGLECQQVTCADGGTTTLTGKVYDPSGQVPLYNAVVYVPNAPLEPFSDAGVSCDSCASQITGKPIAITSTDPSGTFKLENVPTGNDIPLVFQIGKWRRKVTIPSVPSCQSTPLTNVDQLRLPRNSSEGDIPKMAIATGSADHFECLLLKMGIDPAEFTKPAGGGKVAFYRSNGLKLDGGQPAASTLWDDQAELQKYDVVLLPCEGSEDRKTATENQNIVDYTSAGGRIFATHYSYVWTAYGADPFPSTAAWHPDNAQTYNPPQGNSKEPPFNVDINRDFPKGDAFYQWLDNVGALNSDGTLSLYETRDDVGIVNSDGGTTPWAGAPNPNRSNEFSTQHLTFNTPYNPPPLADGGTPVQCGRVVFSDFHVTTNAIVSGGTTFPNDCKSGALTAQEKALVFMLFDVSACVQNDDTAPTVCGSTGTSCSDDSQCCSGMACRSNGGDPPQSVCQPIIN